MRSELAFSLAPEIQTKHRPANKITTELGEHRQMESAVDEARSESGIGGPSAQEGGPANYTQGGLTAYTQGNSVHNGTENVGMAGVTQVLENQGDHGGREQTVQVGMADGNHPTSLNISNVPGGVQVAVAVQSATGVSVVDGSIASGTTVDRSDESHATSLQVTAMPPEYGLPTSLASQYVLPQEQDEGEDVHGDLDGDDKDREDVLREQDRFLPIANVARIMKKSIPKTGKIAKDAKECVQECVSEFISFITSEASERCHQEKRKTINGEDILFAMQTLGFDNYVEPLKLYLQKYRESIKGDKSALTTEEERPELAEEVQHYQVQATHIHPSMIAADQTPTTIYSTTPYQTTMQQPLHFP